jgi:hypothetical protein
VKPKASSGPFYQADRIVLILIIVDQLLLSLLGILKYSLAPAAENSNRFFPLFMWLGIPCAFSLFLKSSAARLAAALWHSLFVFLTLSGAWSMMLVGSAAEPFRHWVVADCMVIVYLAGTSAMLFFDGKFLPSRKVDGPKIARVMDAMIVCGVALVQLTFAGFFLFAQFAFAYHGGFHPIVTPCLILGVCSALFLFSGQLASRIVSTSWQSIVAAGILIAADPTSSSDATLRLWALWLVPGSLYLAVTSVPRFRNLRPIQQPAVKDIS